MPWPKEHRVPSWTVYKMGITCTKQSKENRERSSEGIQLQMYQRSRVYTHRWARCHIGHSLYYGSIESCIHRNDVHRSTHAYGNIATSSSSGQTSEDECESDLEHDNWTLVFDTALASNMVLCERDKITEVKCNLSSALWQRQCLLALRCPDHS